MTNERDNLSKEDLFLLLESYKNSVEMNTLISQQLSTILEVLQNCKDDNAKAIEDIHKQIKDIMNGINISKEKHNTTRVDDIKTFGKLSNKINLLYVGVGSIVLAVIYMAVNLIDKYNLLTAIAKKLGV